MSFIDKIKSSFNNYLIRVARENKELFGDGRPDCCSLNRQNVSSDNHKTDYKNK